MHYSFETYRIFLWYIKFFFFLENFHSHYKTSLLWTKWTWAQHKGGDKIKNKHIHTLKLVVMEANLLSAVSGFPMR